MTGGLETLRKRFWAVARPFFRSELRWRAVGLFVLVLTFILGLGGLNYLANHTAGAFMTAVAGHDADRAVAFGVWWAGVFAALTVVGVLKAFTEDRLKLLWRQWLTGHFFGRYLAGHAYYRLQGRAGTVDNPDQRVAEDVRTFTDQAVAIFFILVNSALVLALFSQVLWSITPWLLGAAVLYAALGSLTTALLSRRLVKLDVQQFRKEADFRYDLIQVRTHAESVAVLGGEAAESGRLRRALDAAVENMKGVIGVSRNISFFTNGFDYLAQLIPLLIVAPLYIRGDIEFGALEQGRQGFALVMGAFAIIVKEFQRLSTFAAVVERLGTFGEALDEANGHAKDPIEVVEEPGRLAFERLTLTTPGDGRLLIRDLSLTLRPGHRVLVSGPSGSGRSALMRAACGLWPSGHGRVVRPPLDELLVLPQQPYLRPGTLREQLLYGVRANRHTDAELGEALRGVGLGEVLERAGGPDGVADWPNSLSLGEQQRVALARLLLARPGFAIVDEATSALGAGEARRLYELLAATPMAYLTLAGDTALEESHDEVIQLGQNGNWSAAAGGRDRSSLGLARVAGQRL